MTKKTLLKLILSKEEYNFISSALNTAIETYKDRYSFDTSDSYHCGALKRNILKLVEINKKYFNA